MKFTKQKFLISSILLVAGCANNGSLYYWGNYETQLYAIYSDPGKSSPEQQLIKLEEDYQKARSQNKQVPPGFHAHLGYLYYGVGKTDQAFQQFETEKSLYPESITYMNSLIKRLKGEK